MTKPVPPKRNKWWLAQLALILLVIVIILLFQRWNINQLVSHPNPVKSYEEAVQRIQAAKAGEGNLNPVCQAKFLTHGKQTARTIVFVHGYTTCPQQFAELGKRFYELGYNVLIMPAPHHGLMDRYSHDQGNLTAEEMIVYADNIVDIAQGLGQHVTIAGFSMGGVIAAWVGQNRSDVDLAVAISPEFSFKEVPGWAITPVDNIFLMLPVSYEWWNPALKEKTEPSYAYPIYSKRVLGEQLRISFAVQAQAEQSAPRAKALLVITNGNELAVDNNMTAQVVKLWQANHAHVSTYEFPQKLEIVHDMIDATGNPGAHMDVVYPKLIELINQ